MASSQASKVVVQDEIRQSVRSIVMDLEANPWEVITKQFDEEEYEQVIAVLLEMLDSFETPRDIRPKCLKCLQAMPQHSVGLEHQTSYQDNWRATREIVEQALTDSYSTQYEDRQLELMLSGDRLPYAVDVLLKELDSLQTKILLSSLPSPELWEKSDDIFRFLRGIAQRAQIDGREFPRFIIAWALAAPVSDEIMYELVSDDYMLEDLRCVARLLLMQIDLQDTPYETRLKCIECLYPIAMKISSLLLRSGLESDENYILVEWALSTQRPSEAIGKFIDSEALDVLDIVNTLLMFMSGQHDNKIKCIQCLRAVIQVRLSHRLSLYYGEESDKSTVLRSFIALIIRDLVTFSTEELGVVVDILQEELYRLDTPYTIRKSCVEGLQAIAQVSDLVPSIFTLDESGQDDIKKHIIRTVVTQMLTCPKPWELITEMNKDEYQFAVDTLQENLDSTDTSLALRASSIKCLQAISRVSDVVPLSFILEGIKKKGTHSLFRGGFADIWQGLLGSETVVCLKVLRTFNPSYYDRREDDFKALHREALIWRQLKHPRIHPFLGIVRDIFPDQLCLVSPWSDNGNLCDFLKTNPEKDRLKLLIQVAEGIDYLHSHDPQIVHADIRGVNILVKDDYTCCLADFGLTMITETQSPTTTRMRSGATRWMPPEVLDDEDGIFTDGNHKSALPARDIYSFGCTIVEIYSGEAPYPSIKRDVNVIKEIIVNKVTPSRPLANADTGLPDCVWDVAASCLSYDLTMRPPIQKVLSRLRTCYEEPGGWLHAEEPGDWFQAETYAGPFLPPHVILVQTPGYLSVAATSPLPTNSVGVRKVVIRAKSSDDSKLQLEVGIIHDSDRYSMSLEPNSWFHLTQSNPPFCEQSWHFSQSVMEITSHEVTGWDERDSTNFAGFVDALEPGDRVVLFTKRGHDIHDVSIDVFFQLG